MSPSRRRIAFAVAALVASVGGCSDGDRTERATQFAMVCGRGPTVEGIDVSEYQRTVDWAMVRASGRRYAIARVAHLPRVDPTFPRNWAGMRAAGLIRGAYLYFDPSVDAAMQADLVVNAVGRLGPGDLPVTLDVEKPQPGLPAPDVYAARIRVFVERVTAGTGRPPMIYTGAYYWPNYVRTRDFNALPLWHAQYTSTARCPTIADAWSDWSFWQYSSTGRVPGIAGNVDLDRFNGTLSALEALAGIAAPMDAATPRDATVDARADAPRADVLSRFDVAADVRPMDGGEDAPGRDAAADVVRDDADATAMNDAAEAPTQDAGPLGAADAATDEAPADGGCGCRTRGASRRPVAWSLVVLLAAWRCRQLRRASRASQRASSASTAARAVSSEAMSPATSPPPRT